MVIIAVGLWQALLWLKKTVPPVSEKVAVEAVVTPIPTPTSPSPTTTPAKSTPIVTDELSGDFSSQRILNKNPQLIEVNDIKKYVEGYKSAVDIDQIKKYYSYLSEGDFSAAYAMKLEPQENFETFQKWYNGSFKTFPHSFMYRFAGSDYHKQYQFKVDMVDSNQKLLTYNVSMEVIDGKIKTLSSEPFTTDLTGWATYKNAQFNYTFKYPAALTITEDDKLGKSFITIRSEPHKSECIEGKEGDYSCTSYESDFFIRTIKMDEHMSTPQEYIYKYYSYILENGWSNGLHSYLVKRLIDSETGLEFTCECWMGGESSLREVILSHNGYIYIIGVGLEGNAFSPIFDKMISGFELL